MTYDWDIASIYKHPNQADIMEAEAFYIAFARVHNIDGHKILSILTPVKHRRINLDGVASNQSILIVKTTDMHDVAVNTSLRIDGKLYVIISVSNPVGDIVRIELEGNE